MSDPSAPVQIAAREAMAADEDPRVRLILARTLAALCPRLHAGTRAALECTAARLLGRLVEDEAVRVRAAIADVVKDMPDAPRELILRLARDVAIEVCGPVIEVSPLLTPDDLLSLLTERRCQAAAVAVACRPGLPPCVSDAIVRTRDADAIAALLGNRTAAISEDMLEALIDRAREHPEWHEPLVRRPALSPTAALALSGIVAAALLRELAERGDLPPAVTAMLRVRLAERLAPPPARTPATDAQLVAHAHALQHRGALTEQAVIEATCRGDDRQACAMLAVAAGAPLAAVDRACLLRSAKGLVSLTWQAGCTMRLAALLQTRIGRIAPGCVLRPGPDGCFPIAIEEMRFQLDFLGAPTREMRRA